MQVWDSEKLRRGRSCVFVVERTMSWSSGGASVQARGGVRSDISCVKINPPYQITKARHAMNTPGREENKKRNTTSGGW